MNIDKEKLTMNFKEKNWNYVFTEAKIIVEFLLIQKFKMFDEDILQECLENLYKKILANKVDENKNLFAFIWQNSYFRILEILRKQRKRDAIAKFVSYEKMSSYISSQEELDEVI